MSCSGHAKEHVKQMLQDTGVSTLNGDGIAISSLSHLRAEAESACSAFYNKNKLDDPPKYDTEMAEDDGKLQGRLYLLQSLSDGVSRAELLAIRDARQIVVDERESPLKENDWDGYDTEMAESIGMDQGQVYMCEELLEAMDYADKFDGKPLSFAQKYRKMLNTSYPEETLDEMRAEARAELYAHDEAQPEKMNSVDIETRKEMARERGLLVGKCDQLGEVDNTVNYDAMGVQLEENEDALFRLKENLDSGVEDAYQMGVLEGRIEMCKELMEPMERRFGFAEDQYEKSNTARRMLSLAESLEGMGMKNADDPHVAQRPARNFDTSYRRAKDAEPQPSGSVAVYTPAESSGEEPSPEEKLAAMKRGVNRTVDAASLSRFQQDANEMFDTGYTSTNLNPATKDEAHLLGYVTEADSFTSEMSWNEISTRLEEHEDEIKFKEDEHPQSEEHEHELAMKIAELEGHIKACKDMIAVLEKE